MKRDPGAPASLPAVFALHEPERGCVVLDQPQHIATSRPLRLVFDTAALQGFMAPTHVKILEVFPFHEPERGCVVLDQPQHIATSRLLRLVFDTAALRRFMAPMRDHKIVEAANGRNKEQSTARQRFGDDAGQGGLYFFAENHFFSNA